MHKSNQMHEWHLPHVSKGHRWVTYLFNETTTHVDYGASTIRRPHVQIFPFIFLNAFLVMTLDGSALFSQQLLDPRSITARVWNRNPAQLNLNRDVSRTVNKSAEVSTIRSAFVMNVCSSDSSKAAKANRVFWLYCPQKASIFLFSVQALISLNAKLSRYDTCWEQRIVRNVSLCLAQKWSSCSGYPIACSLFCNTRTCFRLLTSSMLSRTTVNYRTFSISVVFRLPRTLRTIADTWYPNDEPSAFAVMGCHCALNKEQFPFRINNSGRTNVLCGRPLAKFNTICGCQPVNLLEGRLHSPPFRNMTHFTQHQGATKRAYTVSSRATYRCDTETLYVRTWLPPVHTIQPNETSSVSHFLNVYQWEIDATSTLSGHDWPARFLE